MRSRSIRSNPSRASRRPSLGGTVAAVLLLVGATALVPSPAAGDEEAWRLLEGARQRLVESSPLAARFVQSYVPAGFSSGDEESGRLYLALPTCLRWDYEAPYPRSYMLCGRTVWSWSPDEPVGDRLLEVSREEAGIDFLLLSTERLRERYEARLENGTSAAARVLLEPKRDEVAFTRATIDLEADSGRPCQISYVDRQGNTTRFELTDYRPAEDEAIFEPPDIRWIDG